MKEDIFKGRGAHNHPHNPYLERKVVLEHEEGIDEERYLDRPTTKYFSETARQGISKNNSPDLPLDYSVNPYQGCEHGCVYCYARNSHQYWGFDAGLGFETNIMVKHNIVEALEKQFSQKNHQPKPIMLSGNTDCYQPAEKHYQLTRKILELCLKVKHPVSIISKNTLMARDADIIQELARHNLVHVYMSINHLDPKLKLVLEPRTATPQKKIELIRDFTQKGIPCGIMVAPIIPSLNSEDIPKIIEKAAHAGALKAGYTIVRLNGAVKEVFSEWIWENFPDRAQKVLHQIEEVHGGKLNDSDWGRRIKGEGPIAQMINRVFHLSVKKYMNGRKMPAFDLNAFCPKGQTRLF